MTNPKPNKPPAPAAPAVVSKSRRLEIQGVSGKTEDRLITDMLAEGIVTNATTAIRFVGYDHDELSLTDMVASLKEQGQAVNRGDLSEAERMLMAQAVTLNAMFAELARRASLNMGQHLDAMDRYLRLALKAQSQSRATVETLAAIKNPPVVYARQANINNGGQQQVNNCAPSLGGEPVIPPESIAAPVIVPSLQDGHPDEGCTVRPAMQPFHCGERLKRGPRHVR